MPSAEECIAGRYRLECPLGEGGMGSVWRARHLELDAPIAVKFQHAQRARTKGAAARFRKEARAAARLKSPNVVRVVDFGIDGDVPYLVMELLEGESLRARLLRQTICPVAEALELTRQAASALAAAHEAGIVHRDLKPSNLFLVPSAGGVIVKLLDFGIAKWFEGDASAEGLTDDNVVVGSAHYMSPEQARGELVDPRADVWSLAVVAYQMLTGVVPFQGANIPDTLHRICAGRFEPPSRVVAPVYAPFDAVFARAFEVDPDLRFESAQEFSAALSHAGGHLVDTSTLPPSTAASGPPGGWAFGRDGATLSVPLGRSDRARLVVGRRARVAGGALVGVVASLVVALSVTRPWAPARSTPTASSAPVAARGPAPPAASVSIPASKRSEHQATRSIRGATPAASAVARPSSPPKARSPLASAASVPPHAEPPPEPLAHTLAAPTAATPITAGSTQAPTHVDPVFGLEVPVRR